MYFLMQFANCLSKNRLILINYLQIISFFHCFYEPNWDFFFCKFNLNNLQSFIFFLITIMKIFIATFTTTLISKLMKLIVMNLLRLF